MWRLQPSIKHTYRERGSEEGRERKKGRWRGVERRGEGDKERSGGKER